MGSVTNLASHRPSTDPSLTLIFDLEGDFAAYHAAEAYLKARGFSVGVMQTGAPTGIHFGESKISKWRNLSAKDRDDLHGKITAENFRQGPVTISIRRDAHSDVIAAFRSIVVDDGRPDAELLAGADLADAHEVIDAPGVFECGPASAPEVSEWQPIKTVPKNESRTVPRLLSMNPATRDHS